MPLLLPPPPVTPYGAPTTAAVSTTQRARRAVLTGLRAAGSATAALRVDPDYLIIGTKRGGTTSLARWLLLHPSVRPLFPARETRKGTYYFDVNYGRGEAWYRSHFPTALATGARRIIAGRPLLVGEATPYYLHHPHAPARARRLVPTVRVIALLRHPADRAHGHWAERRRQGIEHLSFADAIAAEPERLAGEEARMLADPSYTSFAHQHFAYLDQGRYGRGLRRWMTAFPTDQVLVLRSEDLYREPLTVYGQVLDFLGLEPFQPDELAAWNQRRQSSLDDATRQAITARLAPDIAEVEDLLDRPMEWT